MRLRGSASWLILPVTFATFSSSSVASAEVVRFALVAGNNHGADHGSSLRYAGRDAERFASLLTEIGGFDADRVVLLQDESAAEFRTTFAEINGAIRELSSLPVTDSLLVVYFSGHSDGMTLEFGSDRLAFNDLREMLDTSPATTKVAFVDSCHSGKLTASKGGRPGPAFDLVLSDNLDTDGTAIVTSSAGNENSQESGEIQGSFFSHYLMSGLRGAADQNHDERVTLTEVYEYAYAKTVVDTARTLSGPQHPAYDYRLSGRGEVVLTNLSMGRATLSFGPDADGSFVVVDRQRHAVVAELTKRAGDSRRLVLQPGVYAVGTRRAGRVLGQEISLGDGAEVQLDVSTMHEEPTLLTSAKGDEGLHRGRAVLVHYGMSSGVLQSYGVVHEGGLGVRIDLGPVSVIPQASIAGARIDDKDLEIRYRMQLYSAGSYALWRFEYSPLDLFAGTSLAGSYAKQRLRDQTEYAGIVGSVGFVAGLDLSLYEGMTVQAFWEGGSTFFRSDNAFSRHLFVKGVFGVGYGF